MMLNVRSLQDMHRQICCTYGLACLKHDCPLPETDSEQGS